MVLPEFVPLFSQLHFTRELPGDGKDEDANLPPPQPSVDAALIVNTSYILYKSVKSRQRVPAELSCVIYQASED